MTFFCEKKCGDELGPHISKIVTAPDLDDRTFRNIHCMLFTQVDADVSKRCLGCMLFTQVDAEVKS